MEWDFYKTLSDVVSNLAGGSYGEDAAVRLKNEHGYHQDYKLGLHDTPYFPERHGTNLTSQPGNYLGGINKADVSINRDIDYNVGGQFSPLRGIQLNPRSMFDKAATLVHEARHYKDAFEPVGDYYDKKRTSSDDYQDKIKQNDSTFGNIRDKLLKFKDTTGGYRSNRILSGQPEWDEIKAQLVSYESMLPAGMRLEQSPLGKAVLQTPEEKLWYMQHTQPSMSDQGYLDGLLKRLK